MESIAYLRYTMLVAAASMSQLLLKVSAVEKTVSGILQLCNFC